jgi:hypothetical protein
MTRSALAPAALLVGFCSACSLVLPLSDYDVTAEDGADAGGKAADAGPADATRSSDDGSVADAGDAAPADAADTCLDAGDFCGEQDAALYCNDFDMGLDVSSVWSSIQASDASARTRSSAFARSCPSSLQAVFFPADGGSGTYGTVAIADLGTMAASLQVDEDVRVQQLSTVTGDGVLFTQFQFGSATFGYVLGTKGDITLSDGSSTHTLATLSTLGGWHHLSIKFTSSSSPASYAFAFDGTPPVVGLSRAAHSS